jgi:hypothetical protein
MSIAEMRAEILRISTIIDNANEIANRNIFSGRIDKAHAFNYYSFHAKRVNKLLDIQLDLLDAITLATHPEMSSKPI